LDGRTTATRWINESGRPGVDWESGTKEVRARGITHKRGKRRRQSAGSNQRKMREIGKGGIKGDRLLFSRCDRM
jgi:hypothetical protein